MTNPINPEEALFLKHLQNGDIRPEFAREILGNIYNTHEAVMETVAKNNEKVLSNEQKEKLIRALERRFKANEKLHPELLAKDSKKTFEDIKEALELNPDALWSVNEMEIQGHRPDVYFFDNDGFDIGTCSEQTPPQRNCTYEQAEETARNMGIKFMEKDQYRILKNKGDFDTKTKSMLKSYPNANAKDAHYFVGDRSMVEEVIDLPYDRKSWRGTIRVRWAY